MADFVNWQKQAHIILGAQAQTRNTPSNTLDISAYELIHIGVEFPILNSGTTLELYLDTAMEETTVDPAAAAGTTGWLRLGTITISPSVTGAFYAHAVFKRTDANVPRRVLRWILKNTHASASAEFDFKIMALLQGEDNEATSVR